MPAPYQSTHQPTSSAANTSAPVRLAPPQGWKADLGLGEHWRSRSGDLRESLQTKYGLSDPQPLLVRDPEYSDAKFLLQDRHGEDVEPKYYVWKDVENELCWIKSPPGLNTIYRTMDVTEGYLSGLDLEVVHAKTEGGKQSARRK